MSDATPVFLETQSFRHPLVWVLAFLPAAIVLGLFGMTVLTLPPVSLGFIPILVAAVAIPALLLGAKLTTTVTSDGLWIQFFPFHFSVQQIPLDEFVSAEVSTFRPIRDYGGWGLRYGKHAKAYIVRGQHGVLLRRREGKGLLIGSQRAAELEQAIERVRTSARLPESST